MRAAPASLDTNPGTRIDAGLRRALAELLGARRRPEASPAIVLLTDGLQEDDLAAPLELAFEARAAGVAIYVVGLGAHVDQSYLTDRAGQPDRYYYAPGPDMLAAIYRSIARIIPCRPEDYWGGRCG